MILDRPVFEFQYRIRHWLGSLSEEERCQLRRMDPEESLRSMFEGIQHAPPQMGSGLGLSM